jgi:hypothetical protein
MNLTLQEFDDSVMKIVQAGAVPVVMCQCGYGSWQYEGHTKYLYRTYEGQCRRCNETGKKRLFGDFNAPEL